MVAFNYDSAAWRRVRVVVLERDGHVCRIRGPRCKGAADRVDHIIPVAHGGALYAVENLRGACGPCNVDRSPSDAGVSPPPSREW